MVGWDGVVLILLPPPRYFSFACLVFCILFVISVLFNCHYINLLFIYCSLITLVFFPQK